MKRIIIPAIAALTLASCGSKDNATCNGATADESINVIDRKSVV